MAWDYTPAAAVASGVANLWPFARQFWLAVRERAIAVGDWDTWAQQSWTYDSGTLTAATDNLDGTVTLADSTKDWTVAGGTLKRWTEATPGSDDVPDWSATSFDVVIDAPFSLSEPDPRKVIQVHLSTQPSATEIKVTIDLAARTAERVITGVGDLVGRRYWIIKQNGKNWTRGFPTGPNAGAYATGLVDSAATGTLTGRQIRNADILAGLGGTADVVYLDDLGKLQRGALATVAGSVLTYTGTTAPPALDGRFFVIESGGLWRWGVTGGTIQSAYSGLLGDGYAAHDITDDPGTAGLPTLTTDVMYGQDPLSCPPFPESVGLHGDPANDGRDVDYWIPQDNACAAGDVFLNPDVNKCFRGLWSALMAACSQYVKPIDYTGSAAIPTFTIATWWYYAGINPHAGTCGTHTGSSMPCALGVPYTPIPLWWTIVGADGSPLISGYTGNYDGATISGTFSAIHDGKAVYASTGPTRTVPRRVGRFHDVVYFLPDLDGGGPASPSDTFPGTWTTRAKSTHYRRADLDGVVGDGSETRHAIADGHYARLAGDNFADPGFPVLVEGDDALVDYYNRAAVGTRSATAQRRIDASLTGTVTTDHLDGTVLTDAAKDWLAVDFYPSSNGVTHTGTFTGGSATGGTDGTKAGTGLWASSRFPGFTGTLVGFTIEVLMSGSSFSDPAAVVEKRLVATGNGTTGALTWDWSLSATANGKAYRIREPAVLNRWAGMKVHFRNTDGDEATVAILGNHDDTLFIEESTFPLTVGTTYEILAPTFGAVYHRVAGEWVSTADAGDDPRNPGTNPFLADPTRNLEDHYTEYGLPQPNDVTFGVVTGWQELYDAINVLTDLIGSEGTWKGHAVDADGVPNHNISDFPAGSRGSIHTFGAHLDSYVESEFIDPSYADQLPGTDAGDGPPFSRTEHGVDEEFWNAEMEKRVAWLDVPAFDPPATFPIGSTSRAYVYAAISAADPDPGDEDGPPDVDGLVVRTSVTFDTSCGLDFRVWNYVGGGPGRIAVGGILAAPADWGQVINEAEIFSVDHDTATVKQWAVYTGWFPTGRKVVYSLGFKFK